VTASSTAQARALARKAKAPVKTAKKSSSSSSKSSTAKDGLVDIGVTLQKNNIAIYITAIAHGSPAEIAGLKIGDEIHKIGSKEITRTTSMDVVMENLRGIPGSRVTVEYGRSQMGIKSLEIVRTWKTAASAPAIEMRGQTLIIAPTDLSESGVAAIRTGILALPSSPASVFIDMRKYPTGSLEGATGFVGLFARKGTVLALVETKNTPPLEAGVTKLVTSTEPLFSKETPVAILMHENTFPSLIMIIETLARSLQNVKVYASTVEWAARAQNPSWTMKAPDNTVVEYPSVTLWQPTEEREPYLCKESLAKNVCSGRLNATMLTKFLTDGDATKSLK
jgi:membrane-associated protease RseP (regulator of RpoE activity)